MTNEKTSFVFFGSGPVAAESLRLLAQDFDIEAVVTKPTTLSEMRAVTPDIPVFNVSTKAELDTLIIEKSFTSTVGVLIDFGIIVSQQTINYFPKGIINSHFSLLPELRGADPISFAILEGKQETGVSLMLLVAAMDEGPVLSVGVEPLDGTETSSVLTRRLIALSHALLKDTLPAYVKDEVNPASGVVPKPQPQELHCELLHKKFNPTYTRKLTKQDGLIDWQKPAVQIEREIRAYAEWPKSRTTLGEVDCIITKASLSDKNGTPGELFIDGKQLGVYCSEGALILEKLKPAGKKDMDVAGFLAGYKNRLPL